jgi:signal transduction histidine kinase
VIRTQAERLLEQFADYSPARQSAEEIQQAAAAAEKITRRLAGFGKRQPGRPEVLSPNGVLRRMAKLLETVAGAGVTVALRPGLHAGKVKADEGQFEQLLMNLTAHAGHLCAAGGEIRIETAPAEASFGDDPGAPPSGYVRIGISYIPSSAAGASASLEASGIEASEDDSLALSVAHNLVTEAGGFLSALRAADGSCCLEVLLPRWTEQETPATVVSPALTHTILLVEAREIVRAELHKFFETNGYNLLEAADAGEAIALAEVREEPLDLVIAPAQEAAQIRQGLHDTRSDLGLLTIVDEREQSASELRRSYTQAALLERVRLLLAESGVGDRQMQSAAAGSSIGE